jgi:hypothetical protein
MAKPAGNPAQLVISRVALKKSWIRKLDFNIGDGAEWNFQRFCYFVECIERGIDAAVFQLLNSLAVLGAGPREV